MFSSALWLAETWQLTRQQREHLDSWGARVAARVRGVCRSCSEDIGQFWRRLHRIGHKMMSKTGGGLDLRRATRLHTFAGHAARSVHHIVKRALHTRCLAWWRFRQSRYHSKHDGLHPKRFKAWRWETQLTVYYGQEESEDDFSNVGWMKLAQDRDGWKASLQGFLRGTAVNPTAQS